MKVKIKSFDVEMEVKNNGMELDIMTPDGETRLGDVAITKTGLIWCKGKVSRKNGKAVKWEDFIKWIEGDK